MKKYRNNWRNKKTLIIENKSKSFCSEQFSIFEWASKLRISWLIRLRISKYNWIKKLENAVRRGNQKISIDLKIEISKKKYQLLGSTKIKSINFINWSYKQW